MDRRSSVSVGRSLVAVQESLGWPLTIYFLGLILVLTAVPFDFARPVRPRLNFHFYLGDVVSNVFLFLPLGFVVRLCLDRSRWAWMTAVFCLVVSSGIEVLQLWLPSRVTSPQDVVSNVAGAWMGAAICHYSLRVLDRHDIRLLVLELPLSVVFYLLVPLLWLNALLAIPLATRTERIWASIPVGVIGGLIVGSIVHFRIGLTGRSMQVWVLSVVIPWIFAANALQFLHNPETALLACGGTIFLVWCLISMPNIAFGRSRRFEQPVMMRILPLYLAYMAWIQLGPLVPLGNEWRGVIGFGIPPDLQGRAAIVAALTMVEQVVMYTIFGYLVAGLRGRTGESRIEMLSWVALTSALLAASLEGLRGFHPDHPASLGMGILAIGSGVYGAYLYRMHLRTVWRVLGRLPDG